MRKEIRKILASLLLIILALCMENRAIAYAAEGTVTFGSESYKCKNGEVFPIGIYINGDERMGTYHVEISYDRSRMEYVSGAEREENGIIILEGTATGVSTKYMLEFKSLSGGEAYIEVEYVQITSPNGTAFSIMETDEASIHIEGEDTAVDTTEHLPTIGSQITLGEENYYLLDLANAVLEKEVKFPKIEGELAGEQVMFLTNQEKTARYVYLIDSNDELHLYGYCEEDGTLYSCEKAEYQGKTCYLTNAKICAVWPKELSLDIVNNQAVYFGIDEEGNSGFYQYMEEKGLKEWNSEEAEDTDAQYMRIYILIAVAVGIVIVFMIVLAMIRLTMQRLRKKRRKRRNNDIKIIYLDYEEDIDDSKEQETEILESEDETTCKEEPIISVQNVTMEFKVSTSNASGIKEYIIQMLKKQITYREFKALDNVSFDVYKGEVVGIIGTNGSGKSTILRIVSGALKPTSGEVKVDTKKIQLLTLGTGFDMELTARENVYLNGAIIGLSKEFLDEHYQEIVDFAELEGFMEEKVKNFSSGMVSRLGFAIATVGEVSEILILDEVLSVGDEFFRKKSLKKVKEMIHSGSTVLMVSHSAQTIMENCTKAVWIEKGQLKMVGEPKMVCAAYRKSQEKK